MYVPTARVVIRGCVMLTAPTHQTDPITRGPELYIVNGIWLFIATICVAARLYARISIRNWFGADDVCIIIAIVGPSMDDMEAVMQF